MAIVANHCGHRLRNTTGLALMKHTSSSQSVSVEVHIVSIDLYWPWVGCAGGVPLDDGNIDSTRNGALTHCTPLAAVQFNLQSSSGYVRCVQHWFLVRPSILAIDHRLIGASACTHQAGRGLNRFVINNRRCATKQSLQIDIVVESAI